jgi:hypothetical protein
MTAAGAGAPAREPERIRSLVGRIARHYDLMNRLMTAGLDWRPLRLGSRRATALWTSAVAPATWPSRSRAGTPARA